MMMRYRGQVVDRLGRLSSHQTRWYTTWEAAHHAAEALAKRLSLYHLDRWAIKVKEETK